LPKSNRFWTPGHADAKLKHDWFKGLKLFAWQPGELSARRLPKNWIFLGRRYNCGDNVFWHCAWPDWKRMLLGRAVCRGLLRRKYAPLWKRHCKANRLMQRIGVRAQWPRRRD